MNAAFKNEEERIKPKIGMGVTCYVGSDCYAATIVSVSPSQKTLEIQYDRAVLTKRSSVALSKDRGAAQDHLFVPDPKSPRRKARLLSTGRYRLVGFKHSGTVVLGVRRSYRDPSF